MKKVAKAEFHGGTITMYLPKDINNRDILTIDKEVSGRIEVGLRGKMFVRGVWVKLVAINAIVNPTNRKEVISHNLLQNEENFHLDGLYETFVGFAEGDDDNGSLLELSSGRYKWPFSFRLPSYTPPTYCDANTTLTYMLTATLDSPSVAITASSTSYNFIMSNVSTTESEHMLHHNTANIINTVKIMTCVPKETDRYFINKLMGFMRPPISISLQGINSSSSRSRPVGTAAAGLAVFPFQDMASEYSVRCSVHNVTHHQHSVRNLFVKAQLYAEVSLRESVEHSFLEDQYTNLTAADAPPCIDSSQQPKAHTMRAADLCHKYLLWSKMFGISDDASSQQNSESCSDNSSSGRSSSNNTHEIIVTVPIVVDSKLKERNLRAWPIPLPLKYDMGEITSYTMEGPLVRFRVLLKLSLVKGASVTTANKLICHPVYGEIFIQPPVIPSIAPISIGSANDTTVQNGLGIAPTAATGPPPNLATIPRSRNNSRTNLHAVVTSSGVAATTIGEAESDVTAVETVTASRKVQGHRRRSSRDRSTENNVSGVVHSALKVSQATTTQTSSSSSSNRSAPISTIPRPHSGRRPVDISSVSSNQQENIHANISQTNDGSRSSRGQSKHSNRQNNGESANAPSAVIKTPHAKPTTYALRVEAEPLYNGPAAALYDRNNANGTRVEITTPQRFAPIYRVGEAVVIQGTPFVNVNTPDIVAVADVIMDERPQSAMRSTRLLHSALNEPSTPRAPSSSSGLAAVVGTLIDDDEDDLFGLAGGGGGLGVMQMMTPSAAIGLRNGNNNNNNNLRSGGVDESPVFSLRGSRLFV